MTTKRTTYPTKVPSLPNLPRDISPELRRYLENLVEAVEVRLGRRGDQRDRAITLRELINSGLAVDLTDRPFNPNLSGSDFTPSVITPAINTTVPPAPTGFTATGAYSVILLFWDSPNYTNHGQTEVWRHDADIIGDAQLVGVSSGIAFSDPVGESSSYYYWIRFVSEDGIPGPFNSSAGTLAETALDVEYLLEILAESISESELTQDLLSRIDLIDGDASVVNSVRYLLAQETAARIAAITQEINDRTEAISDLGDTIANEVSELNSAIGDEISDRIAALAQEVSDRNTAITTAVSTEAAARAAEVAAASQNLQSQINDLISVTEYDNATSYAIDDQVTYEGGLYRATAPTTGNLPTDTNYWQLLGDYTSLGEFVGENAAAIVELNNVSATSTSASALALYGLQSQINDPDTGLPATRATLFEEYYTAVEADQAIASATTGLASETYVDTELGNYTSTADLTANYYTKTTADEAIASAVLGLASETYVDTELGNYTTTADLTTNYYTKTTADDAIAAAVLGLAAATEFDNYTTTADLQENYYTKTTADDAIAAAVLGLASASDFDNYTTTADLQETYYTKTGADDAIAAAVLGLASASDFDSYTTTADLQETYYTKTGADDAIAAAVLNLVSTTDLQDYTTTASLEENYYTKTTADEAIATAIFGLASSADLDNYATTATLTGNYYTSADTDDAITAATLDLASTTDLEDYVTSATLTESYYTKTEANSAISTAVSALSSVVGANAAAVEAAAESINGLNAKYTVKIDNNGAVAGYGLASAPNDAGEIVSEFIVNADRFAILKGATDTGDPVIPFTVIATATEINGVEVPAGVYISDAFVANGTITNAKIGEAAIDDAKILNINAEKITAGLIDATRIGADSIDAEKLTISSDTDGTASSIYMDSNGAIKVYDASGTLRVKLGNLGA